MYNVELYGLNIKIYIFLRALRCSFVKIIIIHLRCSSSFLIKKRTLDSGGDFVNKYKKKLLKFFCNSYFFEKDINNKKKLMWED